MTYIVVSQQGAIEVFWLHFWGAAMSSIFKYSRCAFRRNLDSWMANLIFVLHHISSHEMPNVCLFDLSPRFEEYNDWLTAEAKGKEECQDREGRGW